MVAPALDQFSLAITPPHLEEELAKNGAKMSHEPADETMITTLQLLAEKPSIPTTTAWYLADLGEARGKQELFTKQSPQRLKVLREHALIESAVSSNRIEGVTVEQSRVKAVVLGKSLLRDRDEQEIRG